MLNATWHSFPVLPTNLAIVYSIAGLKRYLLSWRRYFFATKSQPSSGNWMSFQLLMSPVIGQSMGIGNICGEAPGNVDFVRKIKIPGKGASHDLAFFGWFFTVHWWTCPRWDLSVLLHFPHEWHLPKRPQDPMSTRWIKWPLLPSANLSTSGKDSKQKWSQNTFSRIDLSPLEIYMKSKSLPFCWASDHGLSSFNSKLRLHSSALHDPTHFSGSLKFCQVRGKGVCPS